MGRKSKEYGSVEDIEETVNNVDQQGGVVDVSNVETTSSDVVSESGTVVADVIDINKMTDEEVANFVKERRELKSVKASIKEECIPMHILLKASAVIPAMTENEIALQGHINRLQQKINSMESK